MAEVIRRLFAFRRGRRLGARRSEQAVNNYVDRYRFAEWAPIFALLTMATMDWLWTLRHLSRGIEEANPILGLSCFSLSV